MNITQVRQRIAVCKVERVAVCAGPRSHAESRAIITEWCEAQALQGEVPIAHLVAGVAFGGGLDGLLKIRSRPGGEIDLGPVLAQMLGAEEMSARLCRHLDLSEDGLSAADCRLRLAELDAEIWALEVRDEAMVLDSEAAGAPIARRGDADPRAVVGIEGEVDEADDLGPLSSKPSRLRASPSEPSPGARVAKSAYVAKSRS